MNGQTILLISDMRQVYLAEILTKYFGKDTSPVDDDLKATPN